MNQLRIDGNISSDDRAIDKAVEEFYKRLYEKGDSKIENKNKISDFLNNIKERKCQEQ